MNTIIRPVAPADAEALRAIYNWAVAHSTATMDTEPRSPEAQAAWIAKHDGDPYPALVAVDRDSGAVVGYASLSPYNPKPGYSTSAEVSVYVHPDWHGRGVGSQLLDALVHEARERGFVSLIALITADNDVSLRLHRRFGFADTGMLRRVARKFDRWVDVAFLQRWLDE